MARPCSVCNHPDVAEINDHLIRGDMTYRELSEQYGLSQYSLGNHKRKCIKKVIDGMQKQVIEKIKASYLSTIDACNLVINKLPEMIETGDPTFTQVLEFMKLRSELLGEKLGPPEIKIVWGAGLEEEEEEITNKEADGEEIAAEISEISGG